MTTLTTGNSSAVAATAVFHLSKSATQLVEHPQDFCFVQHTKFLRNFRKEWSTLDQTYLPHRGVKATASYDVGQTTTFSVGTSSDGDAGSFDANGTFSIAASVEGQWKWYRGPSTQDYQVNFTPSKYHITFSPGRCTGYFSTQPSAQDAGSKVVSAGKIPIARHCDPESPEFKLTMKRTVASTISASMTVKEIGFKSSAQVGWDHTDTISYKGTTNSTWHACGVHGDPASGSPGRVVGALPR